MAKGPLDRIAKMLNDEAPERRMAAVIVLGELKAKDPKVRTRLREIVADDGPTLQRHALWALRRIGPSEETSIILPLLGSKDAGVREAAIETLAAIGPSIVPTVKERLPDAGPEEHRALDQVLARVGGKAAFTALLSRLEGANEDGAHMAAVSMRDEIRQADDHKKRGYLAQLERFLSIADSREAEARAPAIKAGLKMVGYLEEPRAVPLLLRYAKDERLLPTIRTEALIALRFTVKKADAKILNVLLDAAEHRDRMLAQTALITLGGMELPAKAATRLSEMVGHPQMERARFVIDMLRHRDDPEATRTLVEAAKTLEPRRAEMAARALEEREDAVKPLAAALIAEEDEDRARLIARTLGPMANEIGPAAKKKLLEVTLAGLEKGEGPFEPKLEVLRQANPVGLAKALRELDGRIARKKNGARREAVLGALIESGEASDEDRYRLAALRLEKSPKDTTRRAREHDDALPVFEDLVERGFDVADALSKDRSVGLEGMYYVGFHFAENDPGLGEELLREVVGRGGRKKVAMMAKNKLSLLEAGE